MEEHHQEGGHRAGVAARANTLCALRCDLEAARASLATASMRRSISPSTARSTTWCSNASPSARSRSRNYEDGAIRRRLRCSAGRTYRVAVAGTRPEGVRLVSNLGAANPMAPPSDRRDCASAGDSREGRCGDWRRRTRCARSGCTRAGGGRSAVEVRAGRIGQRLSWRGGDAACARRRRRHRHHRPRRRSFAVRGAAHARVWLGAR